MAAFPVVRDEIVFGADFATFLADGFAAGLAAFPLVRDEVVFGAGFVAFFAGFLAMRFPVLKNVRKYRRLPASVGRAD